MTIVNFKHISTSGTDEDALTITTNGERVFNFGRLTTTGDLADGIFAAANNVSIRHFGRIETSGNGAAGILALGENARIENFGSVVTHGGILDPDPNVDGDEFFAEGMTAIGNRFSIANFGRVHVEGESSSALAGVGEDGLVINYGVLESSATNSAVVAALGDRSQAINRGEILVTGAASNGITGDANTHLTNRGDIRITLDDNFGDPSFGMISIVGGSQISNFGLIEMHGAFAVGISALGRIPLGELGLDFGIVNAGRITTDGDLAIGAALGLGRFGFANAAEGQIENSGVIETIGDGAAGVLMIGDGHQLTNSGRITTDGGTFTGPPVGELHAAGVLVSGDDALVENTRRGVIESLNADSAAVELNALERDGFSNADASSTLVNFGRIRAPEIAVLGGVGQETVINHGRIVGDVDLGDGADTFVFARGGNVAGDVILGGGDDLARIENGSGTTRIADFLAGASSGDVIDVSVFFTSVAELLAHSQQRGGDVVINLDHNDRLVLENVHLSSLNNGDFLFV